MCLSTLTRLSTLVAFVLVGSSITGHASAADPGGNNPLGIWKGSNNSHLKGTFMAEVAYFDQSDSWFGEAEQNLGAASDDWWESVIHTGIEGSHFIRNGSEMYARLSGILANTDDIDAAGSNVGHGDDVSDFRAEDAYLGWRSGDLFSSLGKDFLDISFGRQQYVAGNGFIFYDQSGNGGNRGAFWIGRRHAANYAGIIRLKYDQLKSDLIYLEADDNPDSDTKVGGVTLDYSFNKIGSLGGGFYNVDSNIDTRDSMNLYNIRFSLNPFNAFNVSPALKPLSLEGEYVYEDNNDQLEASGWYLSASYRWENASWRPNLTYRYASFEGDNPNSGKSEDFDPLFYGFSDWGNWYQGEILGEYVLTNSNLNSHMVKVNVKPVDPLSINLFFYHFRLDNPEGFGVQSRDFADEWNLTVDWTANEHLSFSLVGAYADPDSGAREFTGGDDEWSYGMLYGIISF
jgi:hypothetical protein